MPVARLRERAQQEAGSEIRGDGEELSTKRRELRHQSVSERRGFDLDRMLLWAGGLSFALMMILMVLLYHLGAGH